MENKLTQYTTREDWLAARSTAGLSASSVPALLGLSAYRGPWDVWCDIHGIETATPAQLARREREVYAVGHLLEPLILRWGGYVPMCGISLVSRSGVAGSPDYWDGERGAEAKTDQYHQRLWGETDTVVENADQVQGATDACCMVPTVRADYYAQCQVYMWLTGALDWDLIVALGEYRLDADPVRVEHDGATHYLHGVSMHRYRVMYDAEWSAWAVSVALGKYREMRDGTAPCPDSSEACKKALMARLRGMNGEVVADGRQSLMVARYAAALLQGKEADSAKKEITAALLSDSANGSQWKKLSIPPSYNGGEWGKVTITTRGGLVLTGIQGD